MTHNNLLHDAVITLNKQNYNFRNIQYNYQHKKDDTITHLCAHTTWLNKDQTTSTRAMLQTNRILKNKTKKSIVHTNGHVNCRSRYSVDVNIKLEDQ